MRQRKRPPAGRAALEAAQGADGRRQEAAGKGAQLVVLPEMFNCPYSNDSFPVRARLCLQLAASTCPVEAGLCRRMQVYAEDIDAGSSDSAQQLAGFAASNAVTLVAGSMPEASQGKLYNTCLVFDAHGKQLARHRKVRHEAWWLSTSTTPLWCGSQGLHAGAPLRHRHPWQADVQRV